MSEILNAAKAERDALVARLKLVEQFIESYAGFAEVAVQVKRDRMVIDGQKDRLKSLIEEELTKDGAPLKRKELARRLADAGIICDNLGNYIGIIIHRNPDVFVRTESGYALRSWSNEAAA